MKTVAVIGYSGSGKTTLIEGIIKELRGRGYSVASIKHVHGGKIDLAGKDTWRHVSSGSQLTIALSDNETLEFKPVKTKLWEALWKLSGFDFVVVEGFKETFYGAKIIVANELEEADKLFDPLVIAFSGKIADSGLKEYKGIPVVKTENIKEIVNIIEKRAFTPPAGLNCGKCNFSNCKSLSIAILKNEATIDECLLMKQLETRLFVNGIEVKLNPFVSLVFKNVIMGLVNSLKGVENPSEVEVKIKLI